MFLWGAALLAIAPLVADCGGGGDDDDDNNTGARLDPCSTVYQAQCGVTCSDAAPCATGLFCSNGACTAQCTSEGGCSSGQVCTVNGRCISNSGGSAGGPPIGPGLSGSGGGGSGGSAGVSGAGGGGDCPDVKVAFQPVNPAVMVVVDRSASMKCHIDREAELYPQGDCPKSDSENDAESRWRSLKEPLLQVMEELQGDVIFGATFYTTGNQCSLDVDGVPFRIENFDEIKAQYDSLTPEGSTPTDGAIRAATTAMNAADSGLPADTPKFIILASDGSPNCATGGGDAQNATVAAVGDAYDSGIQTFVVAIGQLFSAVPEKEARFQDIANAGVGLGKPGGATAEPELYLASDREVLANDLRSIINGVRPCSFDLDVALTNPELDGPKGVVTIDNQPVPFNDPNGWRLADNNTVEFVGTACASIQNGSTNVQASFPCGVETTPAPPRPPPPR
jgi:hypothetical protein